MNEKIKQVEAVRGWWNVERNKNKWDKCYEGDNIHTKAYLSLRQRKVLEFIKRAKISKGARVLELGYGAGQTALELGKLGFEVHGLDISEGLCDAATKRCVTQHPSGKFYLKVGNIESDYDYESGMFDAVVIVGSLQYLYDPGACLRESLRVLKPGGLLIVAQRNIYSLSNMTTLRRFMCTCVHFIFREKYELFPSFKSMLKDSKMGCLFGRFKDTRIFNTKIMLKGNDDWKFEIKKRAFSYFSLRSLFKKQGFKLLNHCGAYYCFSEEPKFYRFNFTADEIIKKVADDLKIPYLFTLARSVVLVGKKP